jgi:hypothetical protein
MKEMTIDEWVRTGQNFCSFQIDCIRHPDNLKKAVPNTGAYVDPNDFLEKTQGLSPTICKFHLP